MTGPKVVGSIPSDTSTPSADTATKVSDKPTETLPTDRVGYSKQFALLRGYAAITTQGKKVVTNPEVSDIVGIHQNTAILAHPFFLDVGFLKKEGSGYVVAPEVIAYGKAHNWNAKTAPHKLAPLLKKTWFGGAIIPRLALGPLRERDAIEVLASVSGAGPKYESQLKTILAFLVDTGLVHRDGDMLRQAMPDQEEEATVRTDPAPRSDTEEEVRPPTPQREAAPARGSSLATAFSAAPEGVLRFNVDVAVDLRDFATWQPDRIAAFWAGIAQVLAAKANVEQAGKG